MVKQSVVGDLIQSTVCTNKEKQKKIVSNIIRSEHSDREVVKHCAIKDLKSSSQYRGTSKELKGGSFYHTGCCTHNALLSPDMFSYK